MKKTAIVLMIMALLFIGSSAFAAHQIVTGTITYNGNPVSGAVVKFYNSSWCLIYSSSPSLSSGAYEIRGYTTAAGYYKLSVDCPTGWARETFYYGGFPGDPSYVNIALSGGSPTAIPACKD
jgi:type 1 fimbria pilin